ncbi:hypothetical protein SAMN05216490_2938 [Mucilaginibacter mallensis]|uniref:Uncharacterized protein n=1 Tax=Mucilaginibacter mallensis TaxID=652787 RepID=A0A1H1Z2L3_MUCMA|nr:hypothetical protein [Mucilaginibacter mallensis]SDT27843.1 hypothetical protein SAMN05216490_2938 [Mucilaginibacter mallensis]
MKVSKRNATLMILLGMINIVLFVILNIRRYNHMHEGIFTYYILLFVSEITYLLPFFYLITLLKYVQEKQFIITCFYALLAGKIISFLFNFISNTSSYLSTILLVIGAVIALIEICVIVVSFLIKNPALTTPFKIYAIVYILVILIEWGVPLLLPLITGFDFYLRASRYMSYMPLLPMLPTLYVIYRSKTLISQTTPAFTS